jgi:hypothetical protein
MCQFAKHILLLGDVISQLTNYVNKQQQTVTSSKQNNLFKIKCAPHLDKEEENLQGLNMELLWTFLWTLVEEYFGRVHNPMVVKSGAWAQTTYKPRNLRQPVQQQQANYCRLLLF